MCGIAGIVDLSQGTTPQYLANAARTMAAAMTHRGSDDSGVWVSPDNRCALAHQRLSIIDTSAAGHQPYVADPEVGLTYNGEIYNYLELRSLLTARGMTFASQSDTEVLYQGLSGMGAEFITYLDGMFAFARYDTSRRELLLGRDPFGEKPLYYALNNGCLIFASELTALTALSDFSMDISAGTIATYLTFQNPPAPLTIASNIRKLRPGHYLRVNHISDLYQQTRYFSFRTATNSRSDGTGRVAEERVNELESVLTESVERRLRADVSLGAFLSGGIDSSTTVSLIVNQFGRQVDTYSVGFSDVPASEHLEARQISQCLGTRHHELFVSNDDFSGFIDKLALMDEPNADHSCLPTYMVAKLAAQDHKVCLTGDGGDELFGGYDRYFGVLHHAEKNKHKIPTRDWHVGKEYMTRRVLVYDKACLHKLFGKPVYRADDLMLGFQRQLDLNPEPVVNRLRELDIEMYLPVVLAKVDRMSMQHSLETRTPFLSADVARFCSSLSQQEMHDTHQGKKILIELLARHIPRSLIQKKKKGFGISPLESSVKASLLARFKDEISANDCRLGQFIDLPQLRQFAANELPHLGFYHTWTLLLLEQWLKQHRYNVTCE